MSTVRRSVEQTISRLVLQTLRERASLAGTPTARADAPQALATLIDQTLAHPIDTAALQSFCATAVEYGFGCVVVPLEHVAACVDWLGGSNVRVGVTLEEIDRLEAALNAGASEIELVLPAALARADDQLGAYLARLGAHCGTSGPIMKLNLLHAELSEGDLLRVCARAATYNLSQVVIPPGLIGAVQPTLSSSMGIKVADVATLEAARDCLAAGAARLGTSAGADLIEAARRG
ncbi:MAG: hypothetical protein H0T53_03710 [Herpetosiphonaceae bacterium]|nr:hypothetical protein [Herpetosiphonaceae bacterium]